MEENLLPMYALAGETTMRKATLLSQFSWNCGFLASKSQGLYNHTPNMNDSLQGNKKKLCSTASQAQNQVQQQITMSTAAPPQVDSIIIITNQAHPLSLNTRDMTVHKTESNDGHDNTDFMPSHNKHQDTTLPHLMPPYNDSHIHQASPIRCLPLESLFHNIKTDP